MARIARRSEHREQEIPSAPPTTVARPEPGTAAENVDRRIAAKALALLRQDADLDDEKFTPPAAIGLCVEAPRTSREPRSAR